MNPVVEPRLPPKWVQQGLLRHVRSRSGPSAEMGYGYFSTYGIVAYLSVRPP